MADLASEIALQQQASLDVEQAKATRALSGEAEEQGQQNVALQDLTNRVLSLESWRVSTVPNTYPTFTYLANNHPTFTYLGNNFSGVGHAHSWSDLPNTGIHQNERHGVPYITAAIGDSRYAPSPHENAHHAVVFLTRTAGDNLYAPTPHGNAHHNPNFVPA